MFYLYVKSFHLIFLIAWMVSLLYLPRLFVYHSSTSLTSSSYKLLLLMEKRLIKIIAIPAMILTLLFGGILLNIQSQLLYENYFLIKFLMVLLLVLYHLYLNSLYKDFKKGYRNKKTKFYRIINEIPTILMIIVIFLIIVKPEIHI